MTRTESLETSFGTKVLTQVYIAASYQTPLATLSAGASTSYGMFDPFDLPTLSTVLSHICFPSRYAAVKDLMRQHLRDGDLKSIDYFTASATSGVLTSLCTNPIWVVKTRMLSTAKDTPGAYRTVREGVAHIWRTEGLSGFYRGLVPSLLGTSHGAVQFYVYEKLKRDRKIAKKRREGPTTISKSDGKDEKKGSLKDKELDEDHLSSVEYLVLSASAKLVAGSATYPYQVVRARLQTHDAKVKYNGARDLVRQIWTREGVRGFYRGYVVPLLD